VAPQPGLTVGGCKDDSWAPSKAVGWEELECFWVNSPRGLSGAGLCDLHDGSVGISAVIQETAYEIPPQELHGRRLTRTQGMSRRLHQEVTGAITPVPFITMCPQGRV
jgi:hypothetical protein